ncbi:MAG TPA: hypothetical protein VJ992_01595 [Gemmatimonadales bacterium]|nr:hypothetical protein [Gemmatimonadales bacterium]
MAAELGGSQISALLESVPGIANVLRSPVADAMVNLIRSAGGVRDFDFADAEELVQYAVRRGLINASEGEQVLEDVRGTGRRKSSQGGAGNGGRAARTARPKKVVKTRSAVKKKATPRSKRR